MERKKQNAETKVQFCFFQYDFHRRTRSTTFVACLTSTSFLPSGDLKMKNFVSILTRYIQSVSQILAS